jgi:hypothetical protein
MRDDIAEKRLRWSHGKHVRDEDEISGTFRAGKRIEIGDVYCGIAHHRGATEMV